MINNLDNESKRRVLLAYIIFIGNGMLAVSVGSLLPFIRAARGISYELAGFMVSLHSCGNLFACFITGMLPGIVGKKNSILIMNAFLAISYALILVGGPNWLVAVAFFCMGMARGASSNFLNPYINNIAPGNAQILNGLHAMFCIGALIFPIIVMLITSVSESAWIYACVFMVIMGIISWLLYHKLPVDEAGTVVVKKEKNYGFFKEKLFYVIFACLFFYLCAEQGIIGWMVSYFKDTGLLREPFASASATIQWTMMLAGRLLTAYLSTKIDKKKMLPVMGISLVIFFVILLVAKTPALIVLGIMGVGFSMAGIYPTVVSFGGNLIKDYPLGWSYLLTSASLGSIIMPSVIGKVAETAGIATGISTIIFAVFVELIALFVLVRFIKKQEQAA
ncbi:MAG: MFS transporter [Bacillota bacterium]|nr:MFS transporter [Bacillota bacterium]